MPLYRYDCPACKTPQSRLLSQDEAKGDITCKQKGCSGKLKRAAKGPSSAVKEIIDNGLMVRKVETYPDVEKLVRDRDLADPRRDRNKIPLKPEEEEI
jgi:hypothetical protein